MTDDMTTGSERFELFELHGGPADGNAFVVEQCVHHGWPDLVPEWHHGPGTYRYGTTGYMWDERINADDNE